MAKKVKSNVDLKRIQAVRFLIADFEHQKEIRRKRRNEMLLDLACHTPLFVCMLTVIYVVWAGVLR